MYGVVPGGSRGFHPCDITVMNPQGAVYLKCMVASSETHGGGIKVNRIQISITGRSL